MEVKMNNAYDSVYHKPVMLELCLEGLAINPSGVYVDCTFGGGGHSKAILDKLNADGVLIAFDQDPDAKRNVPEDDRLKFVPANFSEIKRYTRFLGYKQVDGVLADLGVSSHQFDVADRGFSIRLDGDLDMRMNTSTGKTAAEYLKEVEEQELVRVLRQYGELRQVRKVASVILSHVRSGEVLSTESLVTLLKQKFSMSPKQQNQFLAQIFQAIRIEVNQEIKVLEDLLESLPEVLKQGGRAVFMSYHSLEDRLVKNFFKSGNLEGKIEKDFYGNVEKPLKSLSGKPIVANEEEINHNPRSRSAKLRIAERI